MQWEQGQQDFNFPKAELVASLGNLFYIPPLSSIKKQKPKQNKNQLLGFFS